MTRQEEKAVELVHKLHNMNISREQLEVTVISLLKYIYGDDNFRISNYLDKLGQIDQPE